MQTFDEPERHRPGKGDRYVLPERPGGCFAQNVPVPFSWCVYSAPMWAPFSATEARGNIVLNLVAVYQALGGGWQSFDGNGQPQAQCPPTQHH